MRFPPARAQSKVLMRLAGHPFLKHVLHVVKTYNFRSIILLTGHYSDQIHLFLHEYPFDRDPILVINGGTSGTAAALWRAKESLSKPFFFLDGNVLCHPRLIAQIEATQALSGAPIAVALSTLDRAPQHPQAQVMENSIRNVYIFPDRAPIHPTTRYQLLLYRSVWIRSFSLRLLSPYAFLSGYELLHSSCRLRRQPTCSARDVRRGLVLNT